MDQLVRILGFGVPAIREVTVERFGQVSQPCQLLGQTVVQFLSDSLLLAGAYVQNLFFQFLAEIDFFPQHDVGRLEFRGALLDTGLQRVVSRP